MAPNDGNGIGGLQNLVNAIQNGQQSTNNLLTSLIGAVKAQTTALNTELTALIAQLAGQGPILPLTGYVEGTWTPGLAFGGSATGITYGAQTGTYTKIGRIVLCQFHILLTSKGSATGAATLTGLPATPNASTASAGSGGAVGHYAALASLTGAPQLYGTAGSAVMNLADFGAAASANLADTNFTNTSEMDGSFSFFV
jgi:hypothetical protein